MGHIDQHVLDQNIFEYIENKLNCDTTFQLSEDWVDKSVDIIIVHYASNLKSVKRSSRIRDILKPQSHLKCDDIFDVFLIDSKTRHEINTSKKFKVKFNCYKYYEWGKYKPPKGIPVRYRKQGYAFIERIVDLDLSCTNVSGISCKNYGTVDSDRWLW